MNKIKITISGVLLVNPTYFVSLAQFFTYIIMNPLTLQKKKSKIFAELL